MKEFGEIYDHAQRKVWPGYEYDIERSDAFFRKLTTTEQVLFAIVVTNIEGFVAGYGSIRRRAGISKDVARNSVKTLLGQGIIEHRTCGNDDDRVAGSGFCYLNCSF